MQYIHAWSQMNDALQFAVIFFMATTLTGFALIAYGIAHNVKRMLRNHREW